MADQLRNAKWTCEEEKFVFRFPHYQCSPLTLSHRAPVTISHTIFTPHTTSAPYNLTPRAIVSKYCKQAPYNNNKPATAHFNTLLSLHINPYHLIYCTACSKPEPSWFICHSQSQSYLLGTHPNTLLSLHINSYNLIYYTACEKRGTGRRICRSQLPKIPALTTALT